jgi:hypothetical protein
VVEDIMEVSDVAATGDGAEVAVMEGEEDGN